jgi:hypothetical protein
MTYKKNTKKPTLKEQHKQAAQKVQDGTKETAKFNFSALDFREDAERESARRSAIAAGRAWPMLL